MQNPLSAEDNSISPRFWLGGVIIAGGLLGCLLQLQQPVLWAGWIYAVALLVSLAVMGLLWRWQRRGGASHRAFALWLMVLACSAGFSQCGLRAGWLAQHQLDSSLEGRDVRVTGVVAAMPQRQEGGLRFPFEVESATADGLAVTLPPRLLLGWYSDAGRIPHESAPDLAVDSVSPAPVGPSVQAGERWQFTLRLKAPHGNLNPHGFDYELWLWEQGLQATGYVRASASDAAPVRLMPTYRHPVELARQIVRDTILVHLGRDAHAAGIVAALVTGDQAAIERADWDVFRATGVAHLMSISGLHITLFAWGAGVFVGALWRRTALWGWSWCHRCSAPTAALIGGVALAAAYALFSGWGVPAQRTILMLSTAALLRISGRQWPWTAVWLLACGVVVAADPWALLQAGFWLSFVAVGVLFATDGGLRAAVAESRRAALISRLRQLLHEQMVVTLALTPLTLLLFGQVSLFGFLANLFAIPFVTLVITPLALGGVLLPVLWDAAAWALHPLTWFLNALAALPLASVSVAAAPVWAGAAGVLGGTLLVMRLPWGARVLGVPLLLPVLLWSAPRPESGEFELLAADIGQGNAVIVRTATHTLVYDTGPRVSADSDAGQRVLVPLLRALDERVDLLMLSHRDSDHTGGARAVLTSQPQAQLLSSLESGHPLRALRPSRRCVAGQHWDWDGVQFEVLHPLPGDEDGNHAASFKPNALSCVLRISSHPASGPARSALLAGDIEAAQEAQLVARTQANPESTLRADLLLVPHHGSKTSSTPVFLDAVQPRYAVIQAGYRNRYGHPAEPVQARYRERGIVMLDSPHCGALTWRSAEAEKWTCQRDQARRYWHHVIR
mgnify:CR=1 FL=1